eukprot:9493828-Pyramimonas_sp.AAC.1
MGPRAESPSCASGCARAYLIRIPASGLDRLDPPSAHPAAVDDPWHVRQHNIESSSRLAPIT